MTAGLDLDWQPSAHARRALTLVALALVVGVGFARPAVVALAAVPVAYLTLPARRKPPARLHVGGQLAASRCFEREPVAAHLRAELEAPIGLLRVRLLLAPPVRTAPGGRAPVAVATRSARVELDSRLQADRWGRRRVGIAQVDVVTTGLLLRDRVEVDLGELAVFPQPAPMQRLGMPAGRTDLTGDHLARAAGPGVEFAGIRPFHSGDAVRRINWPVSTRLGRLHVTETAAEHAVDVVIALDAFDDIGPAGHSTLDLTVRGATGLARQVLRAHDRVGVVAIGGWLRWVRADLGERQFYRVAEAMLDVIGRESYVDPDLRGVSPAALPPGCTIVFLSPLLDERALGAVQALRACGHPVTVVDVLTSEPVVTLPSEHVALRLWRLDRAASRYELAGIGVPVVDWDGRTPLDAVLQPILRRSTAGAR